MDAYLSCIALCQEKVLLALLFGAIPDCFGYGCKVRQKSISIACNFVDLAVYKC